ncbi:hypothetical protein D3C85_1760250 [compost metagenome]
MMFAAQALGQNERILRADRHDQAKGDQQAIEVALPHRKVTPEKQRWRAGTMREDAGHTGV